MADDATTAALGHLVDIMTRLRAPGGCPWDREQTHETLRPYVLEEAYEVLDAIDRGDPAALRDELGDLLLQVVFHAELARERGDFAIADVAQAIADKLVRRHPHVFGDVQVSSALEQTRAWEAQKAAERKGALLDDVPRALPALRRAQKLTKRAGTVGFDWPDPRAVRVKLDEELTELDAELVRAGETGSNGARISAELGDVLFALVNLARHLHVDAESALQDANARFVRRFEHIERRLAESGRTPTDAGLDEMESLWQEAKRAEPPED